jgi:hypothetical protein
MALVEQVTAVWLPPGQRAVGVPPLTPQQNQPCASHCNVAPWDIGIVPQFGWVTQRIPVIIGGVGHDDAIGGIGVFVWILKLAVTVEFTGMMAAPGARNGTEHVLPLPTQPPVHPVNSVWLCVTDCARMTLVHVRKSKLQVPGQSIPGGLLVTLPSLLAVTMETMTFEPRKLMENESGALATPPTTSEIEVVIDLEPWNEFG